MQTGSSPRKRGGRAPVAALLCAAMVFAAACSKTEPEATPADAPVYGKTATTVAAGNAVRGMDEVAVREAVRRAFHGPVRVEGYVEYSERTEQTFVMLIDDDGSYDLRDPAAVDGTASRVVGVDGEEYVLLDTYATPEPSSSSTWVFLDAAGIGAWSILGALQEFQECLVADELRPIADGSWETVCGGEDGDVTVLVTLDGDGEVANMRNEDEGTGMNFSGRAGIDPILPPETYLTDDDAQAAAFSANTLGGATRTAAEALGRNAAAAAASTSEGPDYSEDAVTDALETAFADSDCGTGCSYDPDGKVYARTEGNLTCRTTIRVDGAGSVEVSRPLCVSRRR